MGWAPNTSCVSRFNAQASSAESARTRARTVYPSSGVVNQLTPAVSLLVGWIVFRDHFGMTTAFGVLLTLAGGVLGTWLASRERLPTVPAKDG